MMLMLMVHRMSLSEEGGRMRHCLEQEKSDAFFFVF